MKFVTVDKDVQLEVLDWGGSGPALALLAGFVSGCGEELGPERFPTTRVSGTIRISGRPIGKGWVEFHPIDGTVVKLRSAPIRPDGSFQADRVAVGWNQIGLVAAPIHPGFANDFHPFSSSIRRQIPAHGGEITIDLLEESFKKK